MKSKTQIANDLLKAANYYWHDDHDEQVDPINPDEFDPVVDKIFKANAVELEKLYAEINDSRQAIAIALAQALVPDQSLLPLPGYTIAQVVPKSARLHTTPEDRYQMVGQTDTGEKVDFYFTPLFEHQYPKCQLAAVITVNQVLALEKGRLESLERWSMAKTTSTVWLGLKLEKVEPDDHVSFYVGNQIMDAFDKDHQLFHRGLWKLAQDPNRILPTRIGIKGFAEAVPASQDLLQELDIPRTYQQKIMHRFDQSFVHLALPSDWAALLTPLPPALAERTLTNFTNDEPLLWVEITFNLPVQESFFEQHVIWPNCIPLVNRRLVENYVVKRGYDRIILPLRTTDQFLDMHRVRDSHDEEYQRLDFLHTDLNHGTYMLREGSRMRRLNREDAIRQIRRLLEVIEEEYRTFKEEGVHRLREDFEIIEKAINRIRAQMPQYFRDAEEKATYYAMAHFRKSASRIYYAYWETQGELIRFLGAKTGLTISSGDVKIASSQSLIPLQRGQAQLTADDYLNELKITLSSRGRLHTLADIEAYCKHRYQKIFDLEQIERKLIMFQTGDMGRGIVVSVSPLAEVDYKSAKYLALELQNELNTKSAFFTEIKVQVSHG